MAKLVLSMTMSLDGFFSGPGGELDSACRDRSLRGKVRPASLCSGTRRPPILRTYRSSRRTT